MKCWKCKEEMYCMADSGWRKHKDRSITRTASFVCAECRTFIEFEAGDYSECDLDE